MVEFELSRDAKIDVYWLIHQFLSLRNSRLRSMGGINSPKQFNSTHELFFIETFGPHTLTRYFSRDANPLFFTPNLNMADSPIKMINVPLHIKRQYSKNL